MVKVYISFKGNCNEALKFYEESLDGKLLSTVKFSEVLDKEALKECSKDLIIHAEMEIDGTTFIFNDYEDMTIGDNFSILLQLDSEDLVKRYYNKLIEGGNITINLGPNEFSKLYANLTDKFGVNWIIMC